MRLFALQARVVSSQSTVSQRPLVARRSRRRRVVATRAEPGIARVGARECPYEKLALTSRIDLVRARRQERSSARARVVRARSVSTRRDWRVSTRASRRRTRRRPRARARRDAQKVRTGPFPGQIRDRNRFTRASQSDASGARHMERPRNADSRQERCARRHIVTRSSAPASRTAATSNVEAETQSGARRCVRASFVLVNCVDRGSRST